MPVGILLARFIGYPVHDVIEERLAGAVHTAEFAVIAGVDRLKTPELYSLLLYSLVLCLLLLCLLYAKLLRINYQYIAYVRAYWSHWLGGGPQHSLHGRNH